MQTRIFFLDHLRTFAIFLVVLIHAGIVYEPILDNAWLVSDPAKAPSIGLVRMYLDLFVMYLIFFISGYFIPLSLKRKSHLEFLRAKFKRILWPWLIAVFTLIPAYKMIFLYSRGLPQEEWYSYFHLFQRTGTDLAVFSNNPSQNWLWFLPVLFLFQVVYWALSRTGLLRWKLSLKTGILLTFLLALVFSMAISQAGLSGWRHSGFLEFQRERLLPYFLVFLLGAQCQRLRVFDAQQNKRIYVFSNIVLTLSLGVFTVVALNLFFNLIEPDRNFFFVSAFIDRTVYHATALLAMLSFLHVLFYTFQLHLNGSNRLTRILNKNSYSVYIIHMIVLGVIALPMVQLSVPTTIKYLSLTVLTFAVSNGLVYLYNRFFPKSIAFKMAVAAFVAGTFWVLTNSDAQMDTVPHGQEPEVQDTPANLETGLHEAVIRGDLTLVRQHIKAGSNLNEIEAGGGGSPLIRAAVFGRTEIAASLIEAGVNIDFQNKEGSTPLHTAAFFGNEEIVELLLASGADQNIRNHNGSTALDLVSGSFESVRETYDYFQHSLGPIGLQLNYEELRRDRPRIAEMLAQ